MFRRQRLIRKIRLISKFMTLQPGYKQLQYTYCLISQHVKTDEAIKPGQLIEYNLRKIFLEKSYTKCGGETIP